MAAVLSVRVRSDTGAAEVGRRALELAQTRAAGQSVIRHFTVSESNDGKIALHVQHRCCGGGTALGHSTREELPNLATAEIGVGETL